MYSDIYKEKVNILMERVSLKVFGEKKIFKMAGIVQTTSQKKKCFTPHRREGGALPGQADMLMI
jgi:hypothetical protein